MNLSFIFPVFNEGERLKLLFKKIILFNNKHLKNAHYIFINDGSILDDVAGMVLNSGSSNKKSGLGGLLGGLFGK